MANEWEWPKTPSLTLPHVKFEHDKTFHGLIFNEIFKKNKMDQSLLDKKISDSPSKPFILYDESASSVIGTLSPKETTAHKW